MRRIYLKLWSAAAQSRRRNELYTWIIDLHSEFRGNRNRFHRIRHVITSPNPIVATFGGCVGISTVWHINFLRSQMFCLQGFSFRSRSSMYTHCIRRLPSTSIHQREVDQDVWRRQRMYFMHGLWLGKCRKNVVCIVVMHRQHVPRQINERELCGCGWL